jgi:hypothetical protein
VANQPWLHDIESESPGRPADRYNSFTTRCHARVYRHDADALSLSSPVDHGQPTGPSITAATYAKNLSAPSGTWSLTVKSPTSLLDQLFPGDWLVLWWERNGVKFHGTLGNIDTVQEDRHVVGGATVHVYTVSGRDVGKLIELTSVWFNEWASAETNIGGRIFAKRYNYVPGGTPDAVCANMLDAFLGSGGILGGAWTLPPGLNFLGAAFIEALRMRVMSSRQSTPETRLITSLAGYSSDAFNGSGFTAHLRGSMFNETNLFQPEMGTTLYSMLQEWSNPLLNELFFDVDVEESEPDAPAPLVVLRERPFANVFQASEGDGNLDSPWFRLPTCSLRRRYVNDDGLSRSDVERINLFMLYAANTGFSTFDQYALYPPAIDEEDIRRYGIRKFEQQTRFTGEVGLGQPAWAKEMNTWQTLMVHWYGLNHLWLTGNVAIPFLYPEARVGYRLVLQGDGVNDVTQAYIESVAINYNYPRGATTSLGVTRGFRGTDAQLLQAIATRASSFARTGTKGETGGLDMGLTMLPIGGAGRSVGP